MCCINVHDHLPNLGLNFGLIVLLEGITKTTRSQAAVAVHVRGKLDDDLAGR